MWQRSKPGHVISPTAGPAQGYLRRLHAGAKREHAFADVAVQRCMGGATRRPMLGQHGCCARCISLTSQHARVPVSVGRVAWQRVRMLVGWRIRQCYLKSPPCWHFACRQGMSRSKLVVACNAGPFVSAFLHWPKRGVCWQIARHAQAARDVIGWL